MFQIAIPDVAVACKNADVLVFVLPHQFVRGVCKQMTGHIKKGAIAVSMIKVNNWLITHQVWGSGT